METNTLSISGPESAVNAVSRAVVDISLDNVTANVEIDATIRLLDADGNEITSSEIRKNVDSVKVTVPILETKEVTISASAIGEPADGYEQTGTVTVSPETVKIAGRAAVLDKISEINLVPNQLTRQLNIKAGRLYEDYGIRYDNKRCHDGRIITLEYEKE